MLRIINEPTAAAVAYGLIKGWRGKKNILILIWMRKTYPPHGQPFCGQKGSTRMAPACKREQNKFLTIKIDLIFIPPWHHCQEELNSVSGTFQLGRSLHRCQNEERKTQDRFMILFWWAASWEIPRSGNVCRRYSMADKRTSTQIKQCHMVN